MTEFLSFTFKTKFDQTLLLGRSARNVGELLAHVREVPSSSVYYHTHRYLQQHHYLSPEPPNDFAYWVMNVLGEDPLGERIAGIDIIQFRRIGDFRSALVAVLEQYVAGSPRSVSVPRGEEFHFMASRTFVVPTPYQAHTLADFRQVLALVSIHTLYYHIFDAHLRHERGENDFSAYFRASGQPELADAIARLDPYSQTLEGLRRTLLALLEAHDRH